MRWEPKVSEVALSFEDSSTWFRIVRLRDGRWAYIWGPTASDPGDILDPAAIEFPTADVGIEIHPSYQSALKSWSETVSAIEVTSPVVAAEMWGAARG